MKKVQRTLNFHTYKKLFCANCDVIAKNYPSRYITSHCSADVGWLQESTSFGGHSIPNGGHRRVSGLVRASVKREVRKEIESELND